MSAVIASHQAVPNNTPRGGVPHECPLFPGSVASLQRTLAVMVLIPSLLLLLRVLLLVVMVVMVVVVLTTLPCSCW
jgi:hypothetical protein